jgi:hypothetical protein
MLASCILGLERYRKSTRRMRALFRSCSLHQTRLKVSPDHSNLFEAQNDLWPGKLTLADLITCRSRLLADIGYTGKGHTLDQDI